MRNFYIPPNQISENTILISGEERHHIVNVLRLKPNARIKIFDGQGNEYLASIQSCQRETVIAEILQHRKTPPPKLKVTLFCGLPKSDKLKLIIQKTTEIGVDTIVPVICQRSVPRPKPAVLQKRLVRWQRIANESSKQCGRSYFPRVEKLMEFKECFVDVNFDLSLILWEGEKKVGLKSVLKQNKKRSFAPDGQAKNIGLFIGPEGGFSPEEIKTARAAGVIPVTLGTSILRTETAAIVGLALVLYEFDELGVEALSRE